MAPSADKTGANSFDGYPLTIASSAAASRSGRVGT